MENNIRVLLVNLPTSVRGFVYLDNACTPVIVLNARMPVEIQRRTYDHEMHHIASGEINDMNYREYSA